MMEKKVCLSSILCMYKSNPFYMPSLKKQLTALMGKCSALKSELNLLKQGSSFLGLEAFVSVFAKLELRAPFEPDATPKDFLF